jgi:hypothetical protein
MIVSDLIDYLSQLPAEAVVVLTSAEGAGLPPDVDYVDLESLYCAWEEVGNVE